MPNAYSYTCADFPGMETCPGAFTAATREELVDHIEAHAWTAHGEEPAKWSEEDRAGVAALIRVL